MPSIVWCCGWLSSSGRLSGEFLECGEKASAGRDRLHPMPTRHNLTDVQQKTQTTIQDVRNWNKNDSALLTECWTICTEHMFCIVATNTPHITLILNIWPTGALVSFLLWLSRAKVGASNDDDRVGTFHSIRVQILRYQSLLPHHIRQCCCFCTSMGVRVGSGKNSQGREKKCNWRRPCGLSANKLCGILLPACSPVDRGCHPLLQTRPPVYPLLPKFKY